jgi:hypothetical protein
VDQLKHLLILFSLLLLLSCVVTQLRDPTITGNGTKILFVMVPTSLTRLTRKLLRANGIGHLSPSSLFDDLEVDYGYFT